jgi:hypothetical protein
MKYMLTFISDRSGMDASPEEMKEAMDRWTEFDKEAVEAGALIACEPLEDASGATTIRLGDGGDKAVTDGPFAETKEQLGASPCWNVRTSTRRSRGRRRSRWAAARSRSGRSWI